MPDIDDPFTRSRLGDPDTSHEAAAGIMHKMTMLRYTVLTFFKRSRRLTNYEVEQLGGDHGSTYRSRVSELVIMGMVEDSGERVVQLGTSRVVWTITQKGLDEPAYVKPPRKKKATKPAEVEGEGQDRPRPPIGGDRRPQA